MTLRRIVESTTSPERRARALISSFSVPEPTQAAEARVLEAVLRPPARAVRLLRPAVVLVGILAAATVAAATAGAITLLRVRGEAASPAPVLPLAPARGAGPIGSAPPAPVAEADTAAPEPAAPDAVIPSTHPERPARVARSVRATDRAATPSRDESLLVMKAMTVLRHDHDAPYALSLLDGYMAQYPHGAIREEALALSIEAATAAHDGRAPELARRYLLEFPRGRFASAARQLALP